MVEHISIYSMGKHDSVLPLPFDMLARAIMAAEKYDGPKFEANLIRSARDALGKQQFINSFRYSFLLIESFYGDGQFKKTGLEDALKASQELRDILEFAIKDVIPAKNDYSSDTARLLATKPTADEVIEHLIEKRGFYFHGNVKRKDAWKPNEQGGAESLALLAIGIAMGIGMKAANPMFATEFIKRYHEDAICAGAEIVFEVKFIFREPDEKFDRNNQIQIKMPGTKMTPRSSFEVAQHFLRLFQHNQPVSELREANCSLKGSGQQVFDLKFYTTDEGIENNTTVKTD